jgi:alkaline phosphatase D
VQNTNPFLHGVASGDPLSDRVILWTRVTPEAMGSTVQVELTVARDPQLQQVVERSMTSTDESRDYTVKVDQAGLSPGTTYYYRFSALGYDSPVGRTRTAPAGATERLRVGVVSCSSYAHGVFNAYRKLAQRADIDVVLHLGDYIYEYGSGEYGTLRDYQPAHEIISLEDYRARHGWYKLDPDLQEIHRQHPFITVWDDHETANNSWRDGAENHTEGEEGVWAQRKAWGVQAYHEWLPIRAPDANDLGRIYRRYTYGDLADFIMLDTRLYERSEQVSPAAAGAINDPARQLLGEQQLAFLGTALADSPAKWKLLGQQVMFAPLNLVDLPKALNLPVEQLQALLSQIPIVGTSGLIINADQWDGYRAERSRVLQLIESGGIDNVVVLTGDIHTSWGMDIVTESADPIFYNPLTGAGSVAVEFVATSVTSPGLAQLAVVQDVLRVLNPHIKYVDLARKGYLLLDITPERVQGEWWYVDTVEAPSDTEAFGAACYSVDGGNHLQTAGEPSAPRMEAPALAP